MAYYKDQYTVKYQGKDIGYYSVLSDHSCRFALAWGSPWDMEDELKKLGLDQEFEGKRSRKPFTDLIKRKTV